MATAHKGKAQEQVSGKKPFEGKLLALLEKRMHALIEKLLPKDPEYAKRVGEIFESKSPILFKAETLPKNPDRAETMGPDPIPQMYQILWLLKNGYIKKEAGWEALDLGAGSGRNGALLAKIGFRVTGVEISLGNIGKFVNLKREEGLGDEFKCLHRDIVRFFDAEAERHRKYGLITCNAVFHLIKKEDVEKTIRGMMEHTEKGGINVITAFREGDEGKHAEDGFLFKKDELKAIYEKQGWKILDYEEYQFEDVHGEPKKLHTHRLAALIAQKM